MISAMIPAREELAATLIRRLGTALALGVVLLSAAIAGAQPTVVDPDWTLVRTYESAAAMSARWNPVDGHIYFRRRGSGADGLYRFDRLGIAERLAAGSNIAGVVVVAPHSSGSLPGTA